MAMHVSSVNAKPAWDDFKGQLGKLVGRDVDVVYSEWIQWNRAERRCLVDCDDFQAAVARPRKQRKSETRIVHAPAPDGVDLRGIQLQADGLRHFLQLLVHLTQAGFQPRGRIDTHIAHEPLRPTADGLDGSSSARTGHP